MSVLLWSDTAAACGTLHHWTQAYREAATDQRRVATLGEMAAVCGDYDTRADDAMLSEILIDALDRNLPRALAAQVFEAYRCLPSLRRTSAYAKLSAIGGPHCPDETELAAWRVVTGSHVRLRADASTAAPVSSLLNRGNVIAELARSGEWVRVETWHGTTGFVHESFIEPYDR